MRMLERLEASVMALSSEVKNLNEKVDAITNSEGMLFNPSAQTEDLEAIEKQTSEEQSAISASGAIE